MFSDKFGNLQPRNTSPLITPEVRTLLQSSSSRPLEALPTLSSKMVFDQIIADLGSSRREVREGLEEVSAINQQIQRVLFSPQRSPKEEEAYLSLPPQKVFTLGSSNTHSTRFNIALEQPSSSLDDLLEAEIAKTAKLRMKLSQLQKENTKIRRLCLQNNAQEVVLLADENNLLKERIGITETSLQNSRLNQFCQSVNFTAHKSTKSRPPTTSIGVKVTDSILASYEY